MSGKEEIEWSKICKEETSVVDSFEVGDIPTFEVLDNHGNEVHLTASEWEMAIPVIKKWIDAQKPITLEAKGYLNG